MNEPTPTSVSFDPRIVLRPRGLDETFDLALSYLRTSLPELGRLFAALAVAGAAGVAALGAATGASLYQRAAMTFAVGPLLERVVTVYAGKHIFQNHPRIGPSVLAVARRPFLAIALAAGSSFAWIVLAFALDTAGAALGVTVALCWPFLIASFAYLGEVALLERLPLPRVLRRNRDLVMHRYGRTLGLVVLGAFAQLLIALSAELWVDFILDFVLQFGGLSNALAGWPAAVGWLLGSCYVALARLFDYVDARTRREGWDIQVRFNAIAKRAADKESRRMAA